MLKNQNKVSFRIDNHLFLKPEYLNHQLISGNKYRKLKYNLTEAKRLKKNKLLTFGGAYSNHISAVAAVGKEFGFKTVGVIRGEELENKIKDNTTLSFAKACGMKFKFVSRNEYKKKTFDDFIEKLKDEFDDFYLIPEGGTNHLAIKGCEEILNNTDKEFDYVCCPVGTGGTISGIINSSHSNQKILGFPALKGDFLREDISKFVAKQNWNLITDYHFGGYAKINKELISFINQFKEDYNIPLDPIYTGKMVFGVLDLKQKGYFPKNSKILIIHTGGLQGIDGMNSVLQKKQMPLIV
ncbi:1-aminocyclopropane-1-carboxylate deaminase/D-cysteine desulfhydrase [Ichthyenterobacterium magnum]|uniref:1-aminocyclopropane-1-carboxylate deaminase n=1 Tax=Ichthyenterobacterium magnum TaxID=1230530 RepID=A0A420DFX1_9FLAO|nr:pyridoxal-phosphate dependent enzyme [Ichthyenterobacterium magnum]RKE91994.1 1-aminocyclopropane-1-carboxylate deaminase [Ichthyenterobacterium magnum]